MTHDTCLIEINRATSRHIRTNVAIRRHRARRGASGFGDAADSRNARPTKWRRVVAITHRFVRIPPIRSGSGGQTLTESSCCIRQATRHRGHLRVIAGTTVHPFGRVSQSRLADFRRTRRSAAGFRNGHLRFMPWPAKGGRPTPWAVAKRRPAFADGSVGEHRRLPRHDGGIRPGSIPSRTAGGQRAESPGLSRGATLSVNVTGPSLVSVTCMWAPKRPVSTTGCIARARDTA